MPLGLEILLIVVIVVGPVLIFGAIMIWAAIQDGRDERRSRRLR